MKQDLLVKGTSKLLSQGHLSREIGQLFPGATPADLQGSRGPFLTAGRTYSGLIIDKNILFKLSISQSESNPST